MYISLALCQRSSLQISISGTQGHYDVFVDYDLLSDACRAHSSAAGRCTELQDGLKARQEALHSDQLKCHNIKLALDALHHQHAHQAVETTFTQGLSAATSGAAPHPLMLRTFLAHEH